MPVLSEQIAVVDPSVSTEASRFTIALCAAILETPIARVTVTTAGRPSGIAATARATDSIIAVARSSPCASARPKTASTATTAMSREAAPESVQLALQRGAG